MVELNRVDDAIMESMEESYEMSRQIAELHEQQNKLFIYQIGLSLLMNFPEAKILRLVSDEGSLSAHSLMNESGEILLEGEALGDFVILTGSATVESNLKLISANKDGDWIYNVTSEPHLFSLPYSPLDLRDVDGAFDIDVTLASTWEEIEKDF